MTIHDARRHYVAIASVLKAELSISSELNAAQTIATACEVMGIMPELDWIPQYL